MFPPQVFEFQDIGKVGFLVVLEALLSADNALILAIMVRHLPKDQQSKALFYGLLGAFVFRLGAIIGAALIINLWWIQLIGAIYLIYLPVKHFIRHGSGAHHKGAAGASFWMTVFYADLADLAFAIDSVLVAVAIEPHKDKVWVVYSGAVIGIVLLRFAATAFLKLLEKYPALDHLAYVLVGWAGMKLAFLAGHTFESWYNKANPDNKLPFHVPELNPWIFWGGLVVIVVVGCWVAFRRPAMPADEELQDAIEVLDEVDSPLIGRVDDDQDEKREA